MSGLADVRRYDGAVVARGHRDELVPLAVQPRDLQVIDAVRRHKFLTAPQLLELWWPGGTPQVGRRRLLRLFEAGYLDRFRPLATRGSFPWTYQLGREGHRLLHAAGLVERGKRFEVREVYDYRYVLHELHLNAWVLAWRRLLGDRLLAWEGETQIDPPGGVRKAPLRIRGEDTLLGLRDGRAKPLRPDDVVEVVAADGAVRPLLIEYDRTRRVDKNFEKFRRYDSFLCWWRVETRFDGEFCPYVLFVCQDEEHLGLFLDAADHELTGHLSRGSARERYVGRRRTLFADEAAMHRGEAVAYRVPAEPPNVYFPRSGEDAVVRGVKLPGFQSPPASA